MAALMRHGVFKTVRILQETTNAVVLKANFAAKPERKKATKGLDKKQPPKIDSTARSIAAKGFLRPQNSYTPPEDVTTKLDVIFKKIFDETKLDTPLADLPRKFELCSACAEEFDHPIPNSLLHTIETLKDVKNFYETPVDATTPLDKMRTMDLPENLHVQFEYHRFHPETDTMFGGQTAFNRSSTLVTGLKYKGKYKGHNQNQEWPFNS